jgi:DNA-binding MurR/RpiR family transcriptional regulator
MQKSNKQSLLTRVQDAVGEMHPQERRLADLVLNFPGRLAGYTASEIAQLADVSNATVSRFFRKIGYQSFEEARQAVRTEQDSGSAFLRLEKGSGAEPEPVRSFLEQSQENLRQTLGKIDPSDLDALAKSVATAPRVWIIGFRSGQPFARYLGWQVSQIALNVTVLPRDGETLAENLSLIGPDDFVILFALRRTPLITNRIQTALKKHGIEVAIIGDTANVSSENIRFHCVTAATGPLFNHVSVMAVCNLLAARVIELADIDGRTHMREIETWHADLDQI